MKNKIITENQLIDLVEKRGVGIYPFKDVIDEISNYIQNELNKNSVQAISKNRIINDVDDNQFNYDIYQFQIPQYIIKKIDFIESLQINIELRNLLNYKGNTKLKGSGSMNYNKHQQVIQTQHDLKLDMCKINITCYADNKQLIPRTLYLNLYHEFNHAWDNFHRLKNSGNSNSLFNNFTKLHYNEIIQNLTNSDRNINYICNIIYRLFIPSEFNSLISSVYGELKGLQSKSFKIDYKNTQAYQIYNQIKKEYLPYLLKLDINQWGNFQIFFNTKYKNNQELKNNFIKQTEYKLTDLFHNITKTASLYYEDEKSNMNEEYHFMDQSKSYWSDLTKEYFDKNMKFLEKADRCLFLNDYTCY